MGDELQRFVRHARERGLSLFDIRSLLGAAGWKDRQITAAIGATELDLPVPAPPGATSARDVLVHLLAFVALYTWVVGLVFALFAYVDLAFPDPAWRASDSWRAMRESGIRAAMASILVACPAFALLWVHLLRGLRRQPEKAHGVVRRWLILASMFVAAVTLATDLITLVYFLLEGALGLRFALKATALFAIAATGLGYLWLTLRGGPASTRLGPQAAFGAVTAAVVVAALGWGFAVTGSPAARRLEQLDARRLADLKGIHAEIQLLVRDPDDADRLRHPLPATLDEAAARAKQRRLELRDPETGEPYGYALVGDRVYELSATFARPRASTDDVFWNHPAGRHTFRIDALDPP